MACKDYYKKKTDPPAGTTVGGEHENADMKVVQRGKRLRFGVNSEMPANDILQNNLTAFEWAARNKLYPNFWGRYLMGENGLTEREVEFLHDKGCKIAVLHRTAASKKTGAEGELLARMLSAAALAFAVPTDTAIFLELDEGETVSREFMYGFAVHMLESGLIPAFKTNTDARFGFDREYSRGMQGDADIFRQCLIWATSPSLPEYERTTTTHMIHPDEWLPYAPSGIIREDIAVWQYGRSCHPIRNDKGRETAFDVDLVRDDRVIIDRMF